MPSRSPFPGMDPYLEQEWGDVHASLAIYTRDAMQPQLTGPLVVRAERRVLVEDEEFGIERPIIPDVLVFEEQGRLTGGVAIAEPEIETALATEPLLLTWVEVEERQTFLKIIDAANGNRVITIIEFLSPSNKVAGEGRTKYHEKRQECVRSGVNFVEIDLTRSGERELLAKERFIPPSHRATYQACVFRAIPPRRLELYAMPLWSPLATLRIPLRPGDADITLALQPLIDQIYDRGRFAFDYTQPCRPPLSTEDVARLQQQLPVK